ncbi:MAG: phosphoenolpyruvate synthase [Halobacteriales archaeon]
MTVERLRDVTDDDTALAGGKAASLGELHAAGLPVPPGFVVTTEAYDAVVGGESVEATAGNATEPERAAARIAEEIREVELPGDLRAAILEAYDDLAAELGEETVVAVRSSATAEDLPEASFAGQQETFLNVGREGLLDRIRACWASLYTERAVSYREEQGFEGDLSIAVVVQAMVDAEKSGVVFTSDPATGADETIIEAAWGLGEGVVAGEVSPDNYVVDPDGTIRDVTVAEKRRMYVRDPETGETERREVPEEKRTRRVLSDDEIDELVALGERVEAHYGEPQDVEWAISDGGVFLLQSRPITTIDDDAVGDPGTADAEGDRLVSGLGASPGTATGEVRIVEQLDHLDRVEEGDIMVTPMTSPDMVPAMKRVGGIVTDEGGLTSHAAIVSRELGVPAVTGTGDATTALSAGRRVTVDGDRGVVTGGEGVPEDAGRPEPPEEPSTPAAEKPMTATEVLVNVSLPGAAERAAATGADGVGLLRLEHMILELGATPRAYIDAHGADAYVEELRTGIRTVADAFHPRPVRVRTLDAPTDEFRDLEGGEDEPVEPNPMLGYRGLRRSLDEPEVFEHELRAFEQLYGMDYDNIELMFPLVTDAEAVHEATALMREVGIDPGRRSWGVMIETPASALRIEDLIDAGIDFASFGTNDLTQYTLAVDRNNERVAGGYDATHPAVRDLLSRVIGACREAGVRTSICGEAGSNPRMVRFLVEEGVDSISANIDAVADIQREVKRVEQRLLLDAARGDGA